MKKKVITNAFFTNVHVKEWYDNYINNSFDKAIEIIQEPGDLIYVPANWGHGVINLEPSSAVALEF